MMVQMIQASQAEALRRQDEFQANLVRLVRQIQLDNAETLSGHIRRMEEINRELAGLRDEIRRRLDAPAAAVRGRPEAGPTGRPRRRPGDPGGRPAPAPAHARRDRDGHDGHGTPA